MYISARKHTLKNVYLFSRYLQKHNSFLHCWRQLMQVDQSVSSQVCDLDSPPAVQSTSGLVHKLVIRELVSPLVVH